MQHDTALRLSTHSTAPGEVEVRIEGRLDVSSLRVVAELLSTLVEARVSVDLSGLASADDAGADVLRGMRDGGLALHGASLYIRTIIEEASS